MKVSAHTTLKGGGGMALFGMRRKKPTVTYDPDTQQPAVRRSICTGEMTAGFIDRKTGNVIAGPEVVSRGFVYIKESGGMLDEIDREVLAAVGRCEEKHIKDPAKYRTEVRNALDRYIWRKFQRSPVILPVILTV